MRFVTAAMAALWSTFLFVKFDSLWAAPGPVFGIAVIIYILFKKYPVKAWSLAGYLFCMSVVFVALFTATATTAFFGLILGIFTCGFGSMAVFFLTRQFICGAMEYKAWPVFFAGSIVFILNLLVIYVFDPPFSTGQEISRAMAPVIFSWQIITGLYLLNNLDKGFVKAKEPMTQTESD